MAVRMCLNCRAEFDHYATLTPGPWRSTIVTCPECGSEHRLYQRSELWALTERGDDEDWGLSRKEDRTPAGR